jgi:HSP20 family protein
MTLLTLNKRRPERLSLWHNDVDDLFNSFFKPLEPSPMNCRAWPVVDVADGDTAIEIRAEVPGCDPDDIEITLNENTLTLSGEKRRSSEKAEKDFYHAESCYGSFRRDIHLSSDVDTEKIDALCEKGVLTLTCPKKEKAKTFKVKVKG